MSPARFDPAPVSTAVILAAGLGTRMLPLTKVLPKALLPLGQKLALQLLVEECLAAGIADVIVVYSDALVKAYFTRDAEQEKLLRERRDTAALDRISSIPRVTLIRQRRLLGEGHALYSARSHFRPPVAVLFCDKVFKAKTPPIQQAIRAYQKHGVDIQCDGRFVFSRGFLNELFSRDFSSVDLGKRKGIYFDEVFRQRPRNSYRVQPIRGKAFNLGDVHGYRMAVRALA